MKEVSFIIQKVEEVHEGRYHIQINNNFEKAENYSILFLSGKIRFPFKSSINYEWI